MRMKGKKPIFNYRDTWNLDMTLSPIICEGLKRFKEVVNSDNTVAGWPSKIYDNYDFGYSIDEDDEELAKKTWNRILDEMIYAFDADNDPNISDYDINFIYSEKEVNEQGYSQISIEVGNQAEYDRLQKDELDRDERKKKGLSLFATYFDCLWW